MSLNSASKKTRPAAVALVMCCLLGSTFFPVGHSQESFERKVSTAGIPRAKIVQMPPLEDYYPADARSASIAGVVGMYVCVNRNDQIVKVEVLVTSGHAVLDDAGTRIAQSASYRAGSDVAGRKIESCSSFLVDFCLKPDPVLPSDGVGQCSSRLHDEHKARLRSILAQTVADRVGQALIVSDSTQSSSPQPTDSRLEQDSTLRITRCIALGLKPGTKVFTECIIRNTSSE
jgi:hypothetical protein